MKQTAVQWLASNLGQYIVWEEKIIDLVNQSLEMEKEQIMNSWLVDGYTDLTDENWKKEFEEYYNETYETKTN